MQLIQMQLSQKQTIYSQLISAILKSRARFEQLEIKDEPQSLCISEFTDCKRRG